MGGDVTIRAQQALNVIRLSQLCKHTHTHISTYFTPFIRFYADDSLDQRFLFCFVAPGERVTGRSVGHSIYYGQE